MELITGKNLQIVTDCVTFARQFLLLPDTIDYYFEDCPSERFPTLNNAAESNINSICFNKQWFLKRINEHRDDLEFFIFHELRHIHQLYSIYLHEHNQIHNDDTATIELWKNGFNNYIRNIDYTTEAVNVTQEIEVDANAYAQCLVNLLHINDDIELCFSLPEVAANISMARSEQYYNSKPELRRYLEKCRASYMSVQGIEKKNTPIRKGKKIGANDPCPCNSGKKFKRCCRGNGRYD